MSRPRLFVMPLGFAFAPEDVDEHWRVACNLADLTENDNRDVVFLRNLIVNTAIEIALGTGYIAQYPKLPSNEKLAPNGGKQLAEIFRLTARGSVDAPTRRGETYRISGSPSTN